MISDWTRMKAFALALDLPRAKEAVSWDNPVLKAHGRLWVWWSPYIDAALFQCASENAAFCGPPIRRRFPRILTPRNTTSVW
jgi:hypothetical protein